MAKLYFYYGAMGSSKTANALITAYNYEERGKRPLVLKTSTDVRDGATKMRSRIGLERDVSFLEDVLKNNLDTFVRAYDVVIVDEIQFASEREIELLERIVDEYDIPVLCYGLRADFQGHLFPATKALMASADEIHEIKTMCWCGKKATYNARIDIENKQIVKQGNVIELGGNDKYIALCRKHFKNENLGIF